MTNDVNEIKNQIKVLDDISSEYGDNILVWQLQGKLKDKLRSLEEGE